MIMKNADSNIAPSKIAAPVGEEIRIDFKSTVLTVLKDAFSFADLPRSERIGFKVTVLICLLFPWVVKHGFAQTVMIQFFIFSLYGLGWNLIGGYGGQVDLGQAKNVGFSAYTVVAFMIWWDVPFWISTPIGIVLAGIESFILGYPLFKLRGHYFAIATIAVTLVWQHVFIDWNLIGGAKGLELPVKQAPSLLYMEFDDPTYYYYFILILALGGIFYNNWFRKSKLGYQLRGINASEEIAESIGINIHWIKVKVYCISAIFSGFGGAFYAVYYRYVDPYSVLQLELSIMIALMTMIGGAGSMWGPIIGAAILVPLDRYLGAWFGGGGIIGVDFLIYSFFVMVMAAYEPRGIWGIIEKYRLRHRR
jgi:branched-chain amino acid transport system permease protein